MKSDVNCTSCICRLISGLVSSLISNLVSNLVSNLISKLISSRFISRLYPIILTGICFTITSAVAQQSIKFPNHPIRLVVPFPAGGPTDASARLLTPKLTENLGQAIIVDNRSGASTIIGTELVAKAIPDGHTWLFVTSGIAINPAVHAKLPYDTQRDLVPVSLILKTPFILVAHPTLPANNVTDLIRLAKSRPDQLMYPSSGIGSSNHLSGVYFNQMAGVMTLHVPYKGTMLAITDLIAGRVQFQFTNPLSSLPLVRAKKLKVLGVGSQQRMSLLPNTPTISESGLPKFETGVWFGLFTTGGTPREFVNRISLEIGRVLAAPEIRDRLIAEGGEIINMSVDEFTNFFKTEMVSLGGLARSAGMRPE